MFDKTKKQDYFKTISVEIGKEKFEVYFNACSPMTIIKARLSIKDKTNSADIGLGIAEELFAGFSKNIKAKSFGELANNGEIKFTGLIENSLIWCMNYLSELNDLKKK